MSEIDLTLALQLQAQFEEELRISLQKQEEEQESKNDDMPLALEIHKKRNGKSLTEPQQEKLSISLIDPTWELIDPNPDIHNLFLTFNDQFFWGRLAGVEVRWSPRMTLCAGVCSYEGRGGLCSVRLSLPLLKLRPRKDLVETLLHEMIHAYLFVTANNRDRDGHGPEFHKHMYRINGVTGTNISVYHTFHDEVDVYRQHIWQCNGPCRTRRPYFGLLKRTMNRAPGPTDRWWQQHQQTCGGTYIKIQEPEPSKAIKKGSNVTSKKKSDGCKDIRNFVGFTGKSNHLGEVGSQPSDAKSKQIDFPKENVPKHDLKKGLESMGKHSFGEVERKKTNIKSLPDLSNGKVSQIKVAGASHSNVHGFGSHPPPQKKQCTGNEGATGVKSSDKSMIKKSTGGSGSTGLAVRGGSSRTVTVKGKTSTHSKIDSKENSLEVETNPSHKAFSGQGYTLGGNDSKVSKLLSQSASSLPQFPSACMEYQSRVHHADTGNSICLYKDKDGFSSSVSQTERITQRKIQKSLDCYVGTPSPSQSTKKTVRCPVCNASVAEKDINKHLDECVGNFSDDDTVRSETEGRSYAVSLPSVSHEDVRSADSFGPDIDHGKEISKVSASQCHESELPEVYPCPVCCEHCSSASINDHLDLHFE